MGERERERPGVGEEMNDREKRKKIAKKQGGRKKKETRIVCRIK